MTKQTSRPPWSLHTAPFVSSWSLRSMLRSFCVFITWRRKRRSPNGFLRHHTWSWQPLGATSATLSTEYIFDTYPHIGLWSSLFDLHINRHYGMTSRLVRQGLKQSRWKITTFWSAEEFLPMHDQRRLSGITSTFTKFVSIIQGWRLFHANSRWAGIDCAVAFSRVYHVLVRNPVWRPHSRSSSKHFIHAVYTKYVSRRFMRHCTQSYRQHC